MLNLQEEVKKKFNNLEDFINSGISINECPHTYSKYLGLQLDEHDTYGKRAFIFVNCLNPLCQTSIKLKDYMIIKVNYAKIITDYINIKDKLTEEQKEHLLNDISNCF